MHLQPLTVTAKQAAALLSMSRGNFYVLRRKGVFKPLPPPAPRRNQLFRFSDLVQFVEQKETKKEK
ncbi:MAG TPA: helix-turn-helix domain-containing protein [Verrucomicrobiota bacterium]|nr:helix-turn-helix domain-containing protein [Verrucomicrobiota bacterium]